MPYKTDTYKHVAHNLAHPNQHAITSEINPLERYAKTYR